MPRHQRQHKHIQRREEPDGDPALRYGLSSDPARDIVITDLEANIVDGSRKPSSEWALHTIFYKHKPEARAVVHTHSAYCTTFAVASISPTVPFTTWIGDANTDVVPCAPYITFGTEELAEKAIEVCGDSNAVLLANHGIVVCGSSIASAFSLANNMEYIAKLQYRAMCIGQPQILTDEQMAVVMEKFKSYGQPGSHKSGY